MARALRDDWCEEGGVLILFPRETETQREFIQLVRYCHDKKAQPAPRCTSSPGQRRLIKSRSRQRADALRWLRGRKTGGYIVPYLECQSLKWVLDCVSPASLGTESLNEQPIRNCEADGERAEQTTARRHETVLNVLHKSVADIQRNQICLTRSSDNFLLCQVSTKSNTPGEMFRQYTAALVAIKRGIFDKIFRQFAAAVVATEQDIFDEMSAQFPAKCAETEPGKPKRDCFS